MTGRSVRIRLGLIALVLVLVPASPSLHQNASDVPAIELHRTTTAGYFDPARTNPIFVLVIGSDIRQGDPRGGRADSLHVVALDTKNGRGTIVGIPRDSWVPVPGLGTAKINASLTGGPGRVVQTVSDLSGIHFHYWALVEFSHFRKLVDRLGGVDVDVPYTMVDGFSGANFKKGTDHMNGEEALAFARNRHATPRGDFSRSENQGLLLLDALRKFRADAHDPLKVARYLSVFRDQVESNVPSTELIRLAIAGRRVDPAKVRNIVLPGAGGSAGGASVVFLAPGAQDVFRKIRDDAVL